ncbi:tyrosyl-tRNA synthetase [Spiroplasma sp. TIUS-1]|uniref:tyrosine--tRNA ligase n=1 Tax=Spiroplasma sp. TIUS-1 TaxID=216963 RepID=UPI001399422B|nr:tyrosine--tRNA ligase [Spiroplasma sp. TIUS-1]QHX36107.1 tyrosyl-tRNA synthetase [Spiroplasma sp. TIUS-1]
MDILKELKDRGIVKQFTNEKKIINAQKNKKGVYCGFDPTSDSLHIGHLIQIVNLKRFQEFGFNAIPLIGGATGMIGDPSFKSDERVLLNNEDVIKNKTAIANQLKSMLGEKIKVVDNLDFYKDMSILDFLRDVGKHFNLSYLLAKENIATRISTGLSITEFSYTMLQAHDFKTLYVDYDCHIQFGGSDQWGNITSGLDYISDFDKNHKAAGITFNLLTKKDGKKFGKTESGTIWLDSSKTSEYELYQFFINQEDDECESLLMFLTTLSVIDIKKIMVDHKKEPFKRLAQKRLAKEVVTFVHGKEGLEKALKITEALFSGNVASLDKNTLSSILKTMSIVSINKVKSINELFISSGVCSSNREFRELLESGSLYINDEKINTADVDVTPNMFISDNKILIRKGKKKYYLIKMA